MRWIVIAGLLCIGCNQKNQIESELQICNPLYRQCETIGYFISIINCVHFMSYSPVEKGKRLVCMNPENEYMFYTQDEYSRGD